MPERTSPPNPLPNDRAFAPRGLNDEGARRVDSDAALNAVNPVELSTSNADKIASWEAQAQDMANDLGVAVLVHYYVLPHFEWCGPTMCAALIPAKDEAHMPSAE